MSGVCLGSSPGSCPTQLPKALIRYSEMVADLVDDRYRDAVAELLFGGGDSQMRHPEDRDPVGHHSAVRHCAASREGYALVQAEQHAAVPTLLCGCRPVLDDNGHVLDVSGQFIRDGIESFRHQIFKPIPANIDCHGCENIGARSVRIQ